MSDKNRKTMENYSIFAPYVKGKVRKEKIKARQNGKMLSKQEVKEIRQKAVRRARGLGTVGVMAAIGLTGLVAATNHNKVLGLEAGKEETRVENDYNGNVVIDSNSETITVEKNEQTGKREAFVNGIKVVLPSDIEKDTKKEIGELSTSEEILNYTKNMYVEEYNKNKSSDKEEINVDGITIEKSTRGEISKDEQTGAHIYKTDYQQENDGIYTIRNNGEILEMIVRDNDNFYSAYKENSEITESYTKDIFNIIGAGTDYSIAFDQNEQGKTSESNLEAYKSKLTQSVYNKKLKDYQSLTNSGNNTEKTQTTQDLEQDEELEQ